MASSKGRVSPPAMTPQARENQLTALAMDLAEQQLREGTASAQVISHFLKQGAAETELKKENLALRHELKQGTSCPGDSGTNRRHDFVRLFHRRSRCDLLGRRRINRQKVRLQERSVH